jgi:nuclear receptor-binding protein
LGIRAADSAQDLAAELVHYGFLHEVGSMCSQSGRGQGGPGLFVSPCLSTPLQDDRMKLAAFLETTFLKYRGTQA